MNYHISVCLIWFRCVNRLLFNPYLKPRIKWLLCTDILPGIFCRRNFQNPGFKCNFLGYFDSSFAKVGLPYEYRYVQLTKELIQNYWAMGKTVKTVLVSSAGPHATNFIHLSCHVCEMCVFLQPKRTHDLKITILSLAGIITGVHQNDVVLS